MVRTGSIRKRDLVQSPAVHLVCWRHRDERETSTFSASWYLRLWLRIMVGLRSTCAAPTPPGRQAWAVRPSSGSPRLRRDQGTSTADHIVALAAAESAVAVMPPAAPAGEAAPASVANDVTRPLPDPID